MSANTPVAVTVTVSLASNPVNTTPPTLTTAAVAPL